MSLRGLCRLLISRDVYVCAQGKRERFCRSIEMCTQIHARVRHNKHRGIVGNNIVCNVIVSTCTRGDGMQQKVGESWNLFVLVLEVSVALAVGDKTLK